MNKINIELITPTKQKIYISTNNIKPLTVNVVYDLNKKIGKIYIPGKDFSIKLNARNMPLEEEHSNWLKLIELLTHELMKIDWYIDNTEYFLSNNDDRDVELACRYGKLFA